MADIVGYTGALSAANEPIPQTFVDNEDGTYAAKLNVEVTVPAPEGGATEDKQDATIAAIEALETDIVLAAGTNNIGDVDVATMPDVALSADAATGVMWRLTVTLSGTPGTITTVALKAGAKGIRINPGANDVGYAFDENPAAAATSSSTSIADTAWSPGNTAYADQIEARLIDGESDIRLISETASHVVKLEILF